MRPTFASVRLDAIAKNYRLACQKAPGSKNIAVIKSNAYGHGLIEVARSLEPLVPAFGVAMIDEAMELRDAGVRKPILVLQGVQDRAEIEQAAERELWLMLHEQQQVADLLSTGLEEAVRVWLKVDTGMHRFGFQPGDLDGVCKRLAASPNVQNSTVLCTHLACADDLQNPMTTEQIALIRAALLNNSLELSIANSAGILFWPESHAEWNRPGYMLYGNCPSSSFESDAIGLCPAMSMNSEVIAIRQLAPGQGVGYGSNWVASRPSIIGTIAIGYGDGYPRHAPNGTPVLVNGQRVPLTGRVSMDSISVDLTDVPATSVGDPVELWGENLNVNELASKAGTIGYEILAGLTGRVPVRYIK